MRGKKGLKAVSILLTLAMLLTGAGTTPALAVGTGNLDYGQGILNTADNNAGTELLNETFDAVSSDFSTGWAQSGLMTAGTIDGPRDTGFAYMTTYHAGTWDSAFKLSGDTDKKLMLADNAPDGAAFQIQLPEPYVGESTLEFTFKVDQLPGSSDPGAAANMPDGPLFMVRTSQISNDYGLTPAFVMDRSKTWYPQWNGPQPALEYTAGTEHKVTLKFQTANDTAAKVWAFLDDEPLTSGYVDISTRGSGPRPLTELTFTFTEGWVEAGLAIDNITYTQFKQISSNAKLAALTYQTDGAAQAVDGFNANDEGGVYAVALPAGTSSVTVGATKAEDVQTVAIEPAGGTVDVSGGSGSAVVTVTAEDGTQKTYTVNFTVAAAVEDLPAEDILLWTNTFTGTVGAGLSSSSGETGRIESRFHGMYPGAGKLVQDPAESGNTAGYYYTNKQGSSTGLSLSRGLFASENAFVMSQRLYFPAAEAGQPRPISITLANRLILTFNYDSAKGDYTYTVGSASEPAGRVNAQDWMKLNLLVRPGAGDTPEQQWANANIMLGRALYELAQDCEYKIVSIEGGKKDNAIPREAHAVLAVKNGDVTAASAKVKALQEIYRKEYCHTDAEITVTIDRASQDITCDPMDRETTERIVTALMNLPNGIQNMSFAVEGLVQTSLNLGIMMTDAQEVCLSYSVRSSVETQKEYLVEQISCLVKRLGGTVTCIGEYPAWEYREQSPLRDKMIEIFEKQYGRKPIVQALHAGVECGLFAGQLPGLDCVSFGPDMKDIHTPKETMDVGSVERTWNYVLEILRNL